MADKRYFEFVEGTSSKFWEIWREGAQVKTRYGRIGADGQTTVKDEGSEDAAAALFEKLVKEKTKKGYVEQAPGAAKPVVVEAPLPDWRTIKDAGDKAAATLAFLDAALCEDAADRAVLGQLMEKFKGARTSEESLLLDFVAADGDDATITLSPPYDTEPDETIKSLTRLRTLVDLSYECGGGGCIASTNGAGVEDYISSCDELGEDIDASDLIGVFDHGQNIIIGHPTKKNARKEPVLYFVDHESGEPALMKSAKALTGRQVLLRLLVQAVISEDTELIKEVGQ